jgi:hypothetical protein
MVSRYPRCDFGRDEFDGLVPVVYRFWHFDLPSQIAIEIVMSAKAIFMINQKGGAEPPFLLS